MKRAFLLMPGAGSYDGGVKAGSWDRPPHWRACAATGGADQGGRSLVTSASSSVDDELMMPRGR